ncbi:TPA: ParA family protein, partial [Enterococcus faecium]
MDIFQGTTFTVGNFKGGVGKTKIVSMLAYDNAMIRNRKTLIIDLDPQANLTQVIARTFGITDIKTTITNGVANGELASSIIKVNENL